MFSWVETYTTYNGDLWYGSYARMRKDTKFKLDRNKDKNSRYDGNIYLAADEICVPYYIVFYDVVLM